MIDSSIQTEQVYVSLDVVWSGTAGKFDARMGEISMESCFIDSMGQEILGETIGFKVRLPSGVWVALEGEVFHQEYPIGFQVRFTDLTDAKRKLIAQVIADNGGQQAQRYLLEEENKSAQNKQTSHQSNRVLIADDDVMTLRMLTVIAESDNFAVVTAEDGREVFRILQRDTDFCAAIFDMVMPHLDGIDLIHFMKIDEQLSRIPIGIVTANQDPKIWDESISAGATVFLPKPFTAPQVQMMLRMLISKSSFS